MARARRKATPSGPTYREIGAERYGHLLTAPARFPWAGLEWEPLRLGRTWEAAADGRWLLPEHTVGWDALGWSTRWLQHDPETPWVYTDEQARFLLWWYAIDLEGRFLDREAVLQRIKGWGKDPLGACVCAIEALGPCRFADWDDDGFPVVVDEANAWVQTAAVSLEQTKNTMRLFPTLFTEEAVGHYRIQIGKEKLYALGDSRLIEAVTSSPKSLQGNRGTCVLLNETHEWIEANQGHEMFAVISDNLTKSPDAAARPLAITNAYDPGEETVAQKTREAYELELAGGTAPLGIMYDTLEAPPQATLDADSIRTSTIALRGDSIWLLPERVIQRVQDVRNPASRSRRFWLNQITATEDKVFSPQEWDGAVDAGITPQPGALVTLGLDPSASDDHTALIGCLVEEDHLFDIEFFTPGKKTGEIDRAAVDRAVRAAFELYDVVGFYSDVHPFESYIDTWAVELGEGLCTKATQRNPIAWDMRAEGSRYKEFTLAAAGFVAAIVESSTKAERPKLTHDGSRRFRAHALNAYRRANKWGFTVRKETRDSKRKIDALPAAILARLARLDYLALPASRRRKKTKSGVMW